MIFDWTDARQYVSSELVECPADYDKIRLEYFCFLDAIMKVADNTQLSQEKKVEWYTLLGKQWEVLTPIYSVMTGHIINTGHNHISPVISSFKGNKKEFASLMVAALRHHPQVLVNDKSRQIAREIEQARREIKQNLELHELCACLFPSDQWDNFDLNAPKMTSAEMLDTISNLQQELNKSASSNRQREQEAMEVFAEDLKSRLGNSISMEELESAILQCSPSIANLIFTQLDLRLEDVNEVWTTHRRSLKKKVLELDAHAKRVLDDTHEKVLSIEKRPASSVIHNYHKGSTHNDRSKNLIIAQNEDPNERLLLDNI